MQNVYDKFEFQKIRDALKSKTRTELGAKQAIGLTMILDERVLHDELERLEEMQNLVAKYGSLPIDVSSDLKAAAFL